MQGEEGENEVLTHKNQKYANKVIPFVVHRQRASSFPDEGFSSFIREVEQTPLDTCRTITLTGIQ